MAPIPAEATATAEAAAMLTLLEKACRLLFGLRIVEGPQSVSLHHLLFTPFHKEEA